MKVGDKVICKKTLKLNNSKFHIAEVYYVSFIEKSGLYIRTDKRVMNSGRWFNLPKSQSYRFNFNDYFYTVQEIRRMKLEALNEKYYVKKG